MDINEIEELFDKYKAGTCTDDERALLERWYWQYNEDVPGPTEEVIEASQQRVLARLPQAVQAKRINWVARISVAAAAIVFVIGFGFFFLKRGQPVAEDYVNDILPGGNKAILTLVNGQSIDLTDAKDGELAQDRGVKIIKMSDGQLLFKFNPDAVKATSGSRIDSLSGLVSAKRDVKEGMGLNAVATPRGGQYHIALPDGTNVWINAGSTLRFPSSFADMPERRVQLSGEAYFEVAQIKTVFGMQKRAQRIPFIVQTAKQEVMVLGTHFNINSYDDEPNIKTTLLEGSVKVSSNAGDAILKPGQEAVNDGSAINVGEADTQMAVAWKNGEFMFASENLKSIMRKVKRWYNVDVVYLDKEVANKPFSGSISKFKTVSEVLNILEITEEVKFKIQGRKIIVMK